MLTPEAEKVVRRELRAEHGTSPEVQRIIDQAVCFLARAEEARSALEAHGSLTITVKVGTFVHPLVSVERTSRLGFLTCLRVLRQRPKRTKLGAPSMGERLVANRFFDTPRSRKTRRYITPLRTSPAG